MKVVKTDSILFSIENIMESDMGKKKALETVRDLIVNNSFDIDEEVSEDD